MRVSLNGFLRSRYLLFVFTIVLAGLATATSASAQTDVIRGKVTNADGEAVPGVRVTATSIPGNVTRSAQTNNSGNYQIAFPNGTGDYMMGFAAFGYTYKQFEIKRLADEEVLVADARLSIIELEAISASVTQQQRPNRNTGTPDISGTEQPIAANGLPADLQGNIAAMAASLPGVLLLPGLDGEPDGFSVLGLGADQNTTTLNGMPTGANGLPRDAQVNTSLSTSSFDPSRGGFSGSNFNITSQSGSNFVSRGLSLVMTTPQMQWTDRASLALGNDYTNVSLGGMASGPVKLNKSFYNVSFQLGRQSRDNQTLLSTNELGLQTAGVAMDSVSRLVDILTGNGVPILGGPSRKSKLSDNGSVFGSIDVAPPSSTSGQAVNVTFNGSWGRQTAIGASQLAIASYAGDRTNVNGGLQARHSGYFGLILSETSLGLNYSENHDDPYLTLPGGRVRVNSAFEDGGSGVQSLSFGGNQGLGTSSNTLAQVFSNSLSWFDNANKHRIKFTTQLQHSGSTTTQASNQLGTFTFNSLADLEAGIPASYTRTLSEQRRETGQVTASFSLGDTYRRTRDFQLQYGIGMDVLHFTTTPERNALVESTFGRDNSKVPSPVVFRPTLGFSWTVGKSNEIAAFTGAARVPRAVIRGGVAVLSNTSSIGSIGSAISNTGLPSGVQQIVCTGPAAPLPDWTTYASNSAAIPQTCADGTNGTVFSSGAPNVSLFADKFAPQKSIRSNLSWNGAALDGRFSVSIEGIYSMNRNQQSSVDLNFAPNMRFNLDDGRPVFVLPTSIVPTTGAIASRDARVSQSFARVTELRSDLESRSAQLSLRLSPISRTPTKFGWSAAYTYSHLREEVSGFNSTAGNPLGVEWANSAQGPHQISYSLRYRFFDAIDVSWNGQFRSGSAFTPSVAGDINGDGYNNDRAFIYGTNSADLAVATGMSELLASSTGATRSCLEKQINSIATRNSCRGPWQSSASLNVTLDRAKFRMPQRGSITFSLSNPLGAADLLFNGSDGLKGWGQSASADPNLLYVRGFDPATNKYKYEVNQRFGATRPQFITLRSPTVLTASMKLDLGPTRERQQLVQFVDAGRTRPGSRLPEQFLRQIVGTSSVPSPLLPILRSQDSLHLTALQADSLASMNRRYQYKADVLWAPVTRWFSALPNEYDHGEAYGRYLQARRAQIDMLTEMVPVIRKLLTAEQRRKLPAQVVNLLDPHYLALIRSGTGMYINSGGGPGAFFGGGNAIFIGGGGGGMEMTVVRAVGGGF
jgi:hypothetical protein